MGDSERYIGGEVAVNIDGGLRAKGHPIGAAGSSMAYEIVTQSRDWKMKCYLYLYCYPHPRENVDNEIPVLRHAAREADWLLPP